MRLTATEKRAKILSQAVRNLGTSTKKSLSERAGILATIKGNPTVRGTDGKTPIRGIDYFTQEDINNLKAELLDPEHIKQIVKAMHSLPEVDKLEVSKGIRNANSFIYNGTKYGTHELLHGGGNTTSSSFSIIAVAGTINDSNTSFTASSEPVLLNINGAFYQESGGAITWTYVAGTITTSVAVGTGGNIYGIG